MKKSFTASWTVMDIEGGKYEEDYVEHVRNKVWEQLRADLRVNPRPVLVHGVKVTRVRKGKETEVTATMEVEEVGGERTSNIQHSTSNVEGKEQTAISDSQLIANLQEALNAKCDEMAGSEAFVALYRHVMKENQQLSARLHAACTLGEEGINRAIQRREEREEFRAVVQKLADWSRRYPQRESYRTELMAIEEAAKALCPGDGEQKTEMGLAGARPSSAGGES